MAARIPLKPGKVVKTLKSWMKQEFGVKVREPFSHDTAHSLCTFPPSFGIASLLRVGNHAEAYFQTKCVIHQR